MLGEGPHVTVDVVRDIFEGRFFWWEVERTELNFQPGSVSFFYNIQNDLAMITVIIVNKNCHHRQADYNEACTPNPQLRVEDSELEGAVPPGMVDSTM